MKFGYFCNTTNWKHKPFNQLLEEAREISVFCDENNWDSIWFTEHHFNHEGMESCTNPLMMGTDIAARTKKIKIGYKFGFEFFYSKDGRKFLSGLKNQIIFDPLKMSLLT